MSDPTVKELYLTKIELFLYKIQNLTSKINDAIEKANSFSVVPPELRDVVERLESKLEVTLNRFYDLLADENLSDLVKTGSNESNDSSHSSYDAIVDEHLTPEEEKLLDDFRNHHNIIAHSKAMVKLLKKVRKLENKDIHTLITGERGTGKELVSKALHKISKRGKKYPNKFESINCSVIQSTNSQSELFGHKKGSFTGATNDREGTFKKADGGTVFLDEIGNLDLKVQQSILRAVEYGEIEPFGGDMITVDVRVIAATNQDLDTAMSKNEFQKDLFDRLTPIRLETPPLKERPNDIPYLAHHFFRFAVKEHCPYQQPTIEAKINRKTFEKLKELPWPGNVRELQNFITRVVTLNDNHLSCLTADMLPKLYHNKDLYVENLIKEDSQHKLFRNANYESILSVFLSNGCNYDKTKEALGKSWKYVQYKVNSIILQLGSKFGYSKKEIITGLESEGLILPSQKKKFEKIIPSAFDKIISAYEGDTDYMPYESKDMPLIKGLIQSGFQVK